MKSSLLIALLLPLVGCKDPLPIAPIQGAVDVSFCDLLSRPDAPTKKLVRVSGYFSDMFEDIHLRDPACSKQAWVWFDPDIKLHTKHSVMKRFNALASSKKEFKVVFVGIIEGPLPPNKLLFPGYGHMSLFHLQITVQAIESVE